MPPLPTSLERETGHAGVQTGLNNELFDYSEDSTDLTWPNNVRLYDRMRRSESKIQAVGRALTLPARRTSFRISPNGARSEVVERLSRNLGLPIEGDEDNAQLQGRRRRGTFNWDEHLRHAYLDLFYGHIGFELVYKIEDDGLASIYKLGPRMPQTIMTIKVDTDGGLQAIEQFPPNMSFTMTAIGPWYGKRREIGVDRLVWYATDREAGEWQGRSILRPIVRNYRLRERFYRVDALTKERNGMGVPTVSYTGQGTPTPQEQDAALTYAKSFRSGEFSGGYLPTGFQLDLKGVTGTLPSALESAIHHGEEMSTGVLAGFLDLGKTETGSRALGESFIDLFLLTENTVLQDHLDVLNSYAIEKWVDVNWGENEAAPIVVATEIGTEAAPTAEAIERLISCGAILPDRSIRNYTRRFFRLPKEDEDAEDQVPEPAPRSIAASRRRRKLKAAARTFRRELFDHELKAQTDFEAIQGQWEDARTRLLGDYKVLQSDQIDELLDQASALIDSGDIDSLGALSVDTGATQALLEERMTELAEEAIDEAVAEAGRQGAAVNVPDVDSDAIGKHATRISMLMGSDLASVVGRKAGENAALSGAQAIVHVREHLDALTDAYLEENLGGALTTGQNTGRFQVMADAEPETFYASELLDTATCEACEGLDGKQYGTLEEVLEDYPAGFHYGCLGGQRCRGTAVALYDESEASVE